MATPSSSATSPSPPMAYLQHVSVAPQAQASSSTEPAERERRKQAVQKFLARAELSNFTRTLRTRLSYASFKTTHNATNVPFSDLDAQAQLLSPTTLSSRSSAAKRKAPGSSNHYNHTATQPAGSLGVSASPLRRGSLGPMAPPAPLGARSSHPSINGNVGATTSSVESPKSPKAQSLFSSILAPPPANQARTILNASDPPVAAPVRPPMSPRVRNTKVARSIAEGTRAQAKSRRTDSTKAERSEKRAADKGKRKRAGGVDADGDVDMEAAATLTSLLLHHRPSMAGSASSPRSSVDGSDAGSTYSHSQRQPSSSRTYATLSGQGAGSPMPTASAPSSVASTSYRSSTPPAGSRTPVQQTTPRPAPTDNEAADLMLFLATSPSPARPSNKDAKDAAAFRALANHGGVMRAKPRVLFSSGDATDDPGSNAPRGSALGRGGEGSFNSSISSIGSDMGQRQPAPDRTTSKLSEGTSRPSSPGIRGPQSGQNPHASSAHLLPPPSLPAPSFPSSNYPSSPSGLRKEASPHPNSGADFNFNDFIHASPSPSRGSNSGQGSKMNLGLRADVGRKLFEEEQMRVGANFGSQHHGARPDDRNLEAGIDLVKT